MQEFSVHIAGFAALTITELLLQECVRQKILKADDVSRLLNAAAERHDQSAEGSAEKIDTNMEAARLIRQMLHGLSPLLNPEKEER